MGMPFAFNVGELRQANPSWVQAGWKGLSSCPGPTADLSLAAWQAEAGRSHGVPKIWSAFMASMGYLAKAYVEKKFKAGVVGDADSPQTWGAEHVILNRSELNPVWATRGPVSQREKG